MRGGYALRQSFVSNGPRPDCLGTDSFFPRVKLLEDSFSVLLTFLLRRSPVIFSKITLKL